MKRLIFLLFTLPLFVSAQQTFWTTSPSGWTALSSPAFRFKANTPDSTNNLLISNPLTGKYNQLYTATQENLRFLRKSDSVNYITPYYFNHNQGVRQKSYIDSLNAAIFSQGHAYTAKQFFNAGIYLNGTNLDMAGGIVTNAQQVVIKDSNGASYTIQKFPGTMQMGTPHYGFTLDSVTNRLYTSGDRGLGGGRTYAIVGDTTGWGASLLKAANLKNTNTNTKTDIPNTYALYSSVNTTTATIQKATSTNVRNDESSLIDLNDGRVLALYSHFGGFVADTSTCTIQASYSNDRSRSWGASFSLIGVGPDPANYTELPSAKKKINGNIRINYFMRGVTALTSALYTIEYSPDMSSIVSGPTQILGFTGYAVVGSDRIGIDPNTGNWLYPYNHLVSGGGGSTNSVYEGKMLVSSDEGTTWNDSGVTIVGVLGLGGYSAVGGVDEPGTYYTPGQGLVYYYRTLRGSVYANTLTFVSGTTYTSGSAFNTNLQSMNSMSSIKYWSKKNMLIGTTIRFIGTDPTIQANRNIIDVSVSNTGLDWSSVQNTVSVPSGLLVNEPNLFIDPITDNLINTYSVTDSVNTRYNLRSTSFPASYITMTYGVKQPASGGTGVNNGTNTITAGGAVNFGAAFTTTPTNAVTFTTTGSTNVTLPTTGTLTANGAPANFSVLNGGASGTLSLLNSLGASAAFAPTLASYVTTGQAGLEVTVHDGTNNYRAGLVVNNTDNIWGLNMGYSSSAIPFKIRSNVTDWLTISASGVFNIPNLTASQLVLTDASKNLVSATVLPSSTTATTQTALDNSTKIATTAYTDALKSATSTLTNKTLTTPKLTGYTVATLPAGTTGMIAYVTDALAPTFGNTLVGGGAVVAKAFYNGTNWINE